jgi:prolyl-tRNA synthetase
VDDAIPASPNLVAGANDDGFHLLNTNYGRDYTATSVTDIATASDGDACVNCGNALRASRGVEVGNIFKLGTRYTDALGARYLTPDGQLKPIVMGSYGIGSGRLLACIAEEHRDESGLRLPITVAPYQVHLVVLTGGFEQAETLYAQLQAVGVEVLFDDREASAGVKFNDADLIGLPLRVTISERSLKAGGAEFKRRVAKDRASVPLDQVVTRVRDEIAAMRAEIGARVVAVPYSE